MGDEQQVLERKPSPEEVRALFGALVGPEGSVAKAWRSISSVMSPPEPLPVALPHEMSVAGNVVLIGGGISGKSLAAEMRNNDLLAEWVPVEHYDPTGMYRKMVRDFDLKGKDITVITSASKKYNETGGEDLREIFTVLGVNNVHVIDTHDAKQVDTEANLKALKESPYVFIDGGNQKWLAEIFKDSKAHKILQERVRSDKNFTIAGTSAGAMIVSDLMMYDGKREQGFGLLPEHVNLVIDTHFGQRDRDGEKKGKNKRGREGRLHQLLAAEGGDHAVGIGIDEGTAAIISGNTISTYGSGSTQYELEAGKAVPKFVTVLVKNQNTIETVDYACKGSKCIVNFASPSAIALDTAKNTGITVPVLPASAKDPMTTKQLAP